MAEPNIADTAYIVGRTDFASIDTFFKTLTVNPPESGRAYKINSLFISNKDQTYPVDIDVLLQRGIDTFKLATTVTIPADAVLVLISKDNPLWLQENDFISMRAAANYRVDATCSYEIIGDEITPGTPYTVPGVPRNLVANTSGSQQALTAWNTPLNDGGLPIRNYIVQYALDNGAFEWVTAQKAENTALELVITGLTNGQTYIFRVAAYNLIGVGPFTDPSTGIFITSFSKPRNVIGSGYNQQVNLVWLTPLDNGGSAVTGYEIRYSSNAGISWSAAATSTTTSTSITGLSNGTGYIFQVRGVNANGPGPWSDSSAVIIPDANKTPPGINKANFNNVADWDSDGDGTAENGNVTTVGTNGGSSYFGTYDQDGNVAEWIDNSNSAWTCGGNFSSGVNDLGAVAAASGAANQRLQTVGFRLCCASSIAQPYNAAGNSFVLVDNPGNPAYYHFSFGANVGNVAYTYKINKYEITNAEYAIFLNAVAATDTYGLYSTSMDTSPRGGITRSGSSGSFLYTTKTGMANKPVNFVNFYSALRYANWLHNNAPTGNQTAATTEDGVYTLTAAESVSAWRKTGMLYWLPNAFEWTKAAYHDPSQNSGTPGVGYWPYATRNTTAPTTVTADASGNGLP